jgi:ribosomal protein S27AE
MITAQNENAWSSIVRKYHKCPRCKNGILDTRVKRSFLVKNLFFWSQKKRYQCNSCGKKSYIEIVKN